MERKEDIQDNLIDSAPGRERRPHFARRVAPGRSDKLNGV